MPPALATAALLPKRALKGLESSTPVRPFRLLCDGACGMQASVRWMVGCTSDPAAAGTALTPLPAILLSLSHCLPRLVTAADHRDTFYTFDDVGVSGERWSASWQVTQLRRRLGGAEHC